MFVMSFHHTGKEEFVGSTSQNRQSTERNCTDYHSVKFILLSITLTNVFENQMN
jgi:hypothetical protein